MIKIEFLIILVNVFKVILIMVWNYVLNANINAYHAQVFMNVKVAREYKLK